MSTSASASFSNQMIEITITRALTELKTLDKRIQKLVASATFVSHQGHLYVPDDQAKKAVSTFQSIQDLIDRRTKMKAAIVTSNGSVMVTICGKSMTIAEAIETKGSIKHSEDLLNRLKAQYAQSTKMVEAINEKARRELETKTKMGSDKDNEPKTDILAFSTSHMSIYGAKLYDPLKIASAIEELETYITTFKTEVDFVLTEKNSTTFIKVSA